MRARVPRVLWAATAGVLAMAFSDLAPAQSPPADVTTYHYDNARTGQNVRRRPSLPRT